MLVEDDESLGFLIKNSLLTYGWSFTSTASGEKGAYRIPQPPLRPVHT